jgi:hypothetical protein
MQMSIIQQNSAIAQTDDGNIDIREQLYNEGQCGPIEQISTATCLVTKLHGILLDLDFCLLKAGSFIPDPTLPAEQIYRDVISKWLERHPVLQATEVRATGNGLHIIIRPDEPIEFMSEEDRARWDAITRVLRSILPTDPEHRGIAGKTRKLGSINSKNNVVVTQLKAGVGVPAEEIAKFAMEIAEQPFAQIIRILTGVDQPTCPRCDKERVLVWPRQGRCYGCGKLTMADLFDTMMTSKQAVRASKEVADAS